MTNTTTTPVTFSDALVRDAYGIAWIGACNLRGVATTIDGWLRKGVPSDNVFMSAMLAHALYLAGYGLGPEFSELDAVRDAYAALA